MAILIVSQDPHDTIDRITLCQAKLLACINQIYSGEESWQESAYNEFLTDLISFCQLEWKMSETGFTTYAPEGQEPEFWKRWVQLESCRRTGYAIWVSVLEISFYLCTCANAFQRCSTPCGLINFKCSQDFHWQMEGCLFHVRKYFGKRRQPCNGIISSSSHLVRRQTFSIIESD